MNILYHVPLSPFCRKVRLSLAEKKIEVQLLEERYWEQDADFLRRNPAGKVPVLKMDGKFFTESAAICEYLEEKYPEPRLMPVNSEVRFEVRRLVSWFDDKFHHEVTVNLLYEQVNRKIQSIQKRAKNERSRSVDGVFTSWCMQVAVHRARAGLKTRRLCGRDVTIDPGPSFGRPGCACPCEAGGRARCSFWRAARHFDQEKHRPRLGGRGDEGGDD